MFPFLFSHSFPIRTIPSVTELHRIGKGFTPFFADFTAGGELHPAPKNIFIVKVL